MNMQEHILAALREQFDRWEVLLTGLSEEQITAPHFDYNWSIKDLIAHLWAWQQISIARMEGGLQDREPQFPKWVAELGGDREENADQTNAKIYKSDHKKPWSEIHQKWKEGFLQFVESGEPIPEKDLLDRNRYPWLKGYSRAHTSIQ